MAGLDDLRAKLLNKPKEDLIELAEAVTALEYAENKNRSASFVPNGKSTDFIKMVGEGKTFVSLFAAANGVGKSATGVNILANICYGPQNQYFQFPLFQQWPHLKRGRIISDTTTIKEKIIPEIKKWFPRGRFTFQKEGKNYESKLITDTGFTIDLMTNNQDIEEFESVDLGFCWCDEPPIRPIYRASVGRLRRGGIFFLGLTPLKHAAWVKDEIVDAADKEEVQGGEYRQKRYLTADIEDNCKQHGTRGILEHEDIEKMLGEYPEEEREARAHGKFGHLMGRVHKMFDKKIHVLRSFALNPKDYASYLFLDPHPRTPDAAAWFALDRNDQIFQIGELYMKGNSSELAAEIKAVEKDLGLRIEGRWIDPSAYVEDQHTQRSLAGELKTYGLHFNPGSKDLQEGIKLTNDALSYTAKNGNIIIKPKFFVFDRCERTQWEFENYIWDEWQGNRSVEKNPRVKPKDANDHMMENIHRALLAQLRFVPMIRQSSKSVEVTNQELDPYG